LVRDERTKNPAFAGAGCGEINNQQSTINNNRQQGTGNREQGTEGTGKQRSFRRE